MMKILKNIYMFLSSIKLAVPIMLLLLGASALGTILESKYNTEYASLTVYRTWWFFVILLFLGINILFATLTRLPWKKRHIGFLVTHLGMLMLLVGSVMTMVWGIDGTMQIYEGSESSLVFLQNNVLELNDKKIPVKRYLEKVDLSSNQDFTYNDLKFISFLPFVDVPEKTFSKGLNINFKIKSAFFDVVQVLNTEEEPEVQMGPATFRIVNESAEVKKEIPRNPSSENGPNLFIKKNGSVVKNFSIKRGQKLNYSGIDIEIVNIFNNAQIVNNKIAEGDPAGNNPALEIKVSKNGTSKREIIYKNIPEFTLNPEGIFGFNFGFEGKGSTEGQMPEGHPAMPSSAGMSKNHDRMKNTVEFKLLNNDPNKIEVSLYKNNELLDKKILNEKELMVTPWMGIEITFLGVKNPNDNFEPMISEPKSKMPLPPSALLLKYGNNQEKWIIENSEQKLISNSGNAVNIYYGRERMFLPFSLKLEKFEKKDYPGSEMAMNYKSFVQVNGRGETREIYMNEPLKMESFTFYQASYQLSPGAPAMTVLSVNRDPGRVLKYLGSIILCLGIIIYTFQKSRRFQARFN